jgi:hypothetical protein
MIAGRGASMPRVGRFRLCVDGHGPINAVILKRSDMAAALHLR